MSRMFKVHIDENEVANVTFVSSYMGRGRGGGVAS